MTCPQGREKINKGLTGKERKPERCCRKSPLGRWGSVWVALNSECPLEGRCLGAEPCTSSDSESETEALKRASEGLVRQLTRILSRTAL